MKRVLFVCLGNICRSPTADAVFRSLVIREGLNHLIEVDSAGTGDWHIGHPPDLRARQAARARGYSMDGLVARQVEAEDFEAFDAILAMDYANLADLKRLSPPSYHHKIGLFLDYATDYPEQEVPDPYYGGDQGFAHVLDLVESAAAGLLAELKLQLSQPEYGNY